MYEGVAALDDLTLLAEPGELIGIVGPSGSGKTAILRAIAGLVPLRRGDVLINGRLVTAVPAHQRNVAMVFESGALVPFLNVADNLARPLKVRHVPRMAVRERVREQARGMNLSRLLHRRPGTLSVGEAGRAGVGRALVQEPSVLLLDEPLAHLDAQERVTARSAILDRVRSLGIPAFYVTHDQYEIMSVADRVAVIRSGRIKQIGTPADLYERPADLFVAGFAAEPGIGLLPAQPAVSGEVGGFRVGARTLPLWTPLPAVLREYVGQEVLLGLRAQDVHDARELSDPDLVTLPAVITQIEQIRPQVIVVIDLPAAPAISAGVDALLGADRLVRARLSPHAEVRVGDQIQVAVDASQAHVFDRRTGRALYHPPSELIST
jgi:multiple sugar transport system ATP-binding protein